MKFKPNHFHSSISLSEINRSNNKKYSIRSNRERYFYPDEWMSFYDAIKPKQKPTFNTLINLGARINEARNIKVNDIDSDRNSIVIRVTKTRNKDGSHKVRIIPCSSQFIKYLKKVIEEYQLKPDDCLPILSTPAANIALKKTLQDIGIPDYRMVSIHNIRKTLECWLLAMDVDSLKVAKHFGHSVAVAGKYYVSPESFSYDDRQNIRIIIGDLYEKRA